MSTFTPTLRRICLVAIASIFAVGSVAEAQSIIVYGESTGRIVSARNDQPLYDVYAPIGRGLMLLSTNYVLQVEGIDLSTQTMSFTAYNHMGVPERPSFWVRNYGGQLVFPGTAATGWLTFTTHYIGDRPYPLPNPEAIEIRFVPR